MDIVYTWVDGSDPVWQQKKRDALVRLDHQTPLWRSMVEPYALVSGRYRDNDELKYSLRSLRTYFPDHGQVFLVTDGQIPDWLDTRHVRVVDHSEILTHPLPTFSSKRIESNLFKIPGLAQRWLYLNDDVFLGPQFSPDDFWKNDSVGVCFLEHPRVGDFGEVVAAENAKRHLVENPWSHRQMAHAPRAMSQPSYVRFVNCFSDLHQACQQEIFRNREFPSLLSDLYGKWALQDGCGFESSALLGYLETHQLAPKMDVLNWVSSLSAFCINDTCDDQDEHPTLNQLRELLIRLFPTPSYFER